ncbi:hypothetical protein B0H13DRAFT_1894639 [Mycena leptocephala]|nr:hypothetical protein B0H13DRAFT_1894639 [Mycena leptocephala]
MPDYEVLHSGQWWADLRHRKAERLARTHRPPELDSRYTPVLSQGGAVITFSPGNPVPTTGVWHSNGKITRAPTTSSSPIPRAIARPPTKTRPAGARAPAPTNSIISCLERQEAELLARLTAPRNDRNDRKRKADGDAKLQNPDATVSLHKVEIPKDEVPRSL